MTRKEALAEARTLFGDTAFVDSFTQNGEVRYIVGRASWSEDVMTCHAGWDGTSWEQALGYARGYVQNS